MKLAKHLDDWLATLKLFWVAYTLALVMLWLLIMRM